MARNFNGSTDEIRIQGLAGAPLTYDFTLSCWARLASASAYNELIGFHDDDGSNRWCALRANENKIKAYHHTFGSGSPGSANATGNNSADTWHHFCGVFDNYNDIACFRDGDNKGTNSQNRSAATGINRLSIGRLSDSSPLSSNDVDIEWVTIWSSALTDDEVAALGAGINPMRVRKDSCIACLPLWGLHSTEIDLTNNGYTVTHYGTPTAVLDSHAPVEPFSTSLWGTVPLIEEAAPGGNDGAAMYHHLQQMGVYG